MILCASLKSVHTHPSYLSHFCHVFIACSKLGVATKSVTYNRYSQLKSPQSVVAGSTLVGRGKVREFRFSFSIATVYIYIYLFIYITESEPHLHSI